MLHMSIPFVCLCFSLSVPLCLEWFSILFNLLLLVNGDLCVRLWISFAFSLFSTHITCQSILAIVPMVSTSVTYNMSSCSSLFHCVFDHIACSMFRKHRFFSQCLENKQL
ncbi:unnamed protein product [Musa acuminata subsp. burmannicoides]